MSNLIKSKLIINVTFLFLFSYKETPKGFFDTEKIDLNILEEEVEKAILNNKLPPVYILKIA